jgi:hypothetical protein
VSHVVTGTDSGPQVDEAWRRSRLADPATPPLRLVWADLHNHSLFSDGTGDPERAFAQLRAAGLDAAALTDHSSIPRSDVPGLHQGQYPDAAALAVARTPPRSVDDAGWRRTGELADAHDVPGEFTAIRGFEWTEPWLGHVNVWFSTTYLPVTTPGSLSGLNDFLTGTDPEALFGYNHPGREPGRFAGFALPDGSRAADDPEPCPEPCPGDLPGRMVSLEAFNRSEDFLFHGHQAGQPSPIVACLDAGWRPGMIGSSDEHGPRYGLVGKGRTGLWVRELSREGIREALLARRTFATREAGLRLDATLDGVPIGGGRLPAPAPDRPGLVDRPGLADGLGLAGRPGLVDRSGFRATVRELAVDIALPGRAGTPVELQLLTGREGQVEVVARVAARTGTVTRADVEVPADVRWVLLRVADPSRGYGAPAPDDHPAGCWALAYAGPWYTHPTLS